ncbi:MAG: 3'(2'),5'-bisphosphate nucleotidase CysQ [Acidobacteria bacterium]|nr:3'(2'),5'-bisphosphate nucleotidase CysQ [Acidobacteriota bacterium]
MLEAELKTAIALAYAAGKLICDYYETEFETEQKLGADNYYEPVTAADRAASRLIVEALHAEFPGDAILSEEEADDLETRLRSTRVWIIDPIDGTAGFVKKDGDFAVQIGLAEAGKPILGVVYMPVHKKLNFAVRGQGAFESVDEGEATRLHVSDVADLNSLSLAMSRNHPSKRMSRVIEHFGFTKICRRGSVGLKVSLIACLECDIYIHPSPRTKLWDTCAPQIILEEAGGRFTDLFGREINYARRDLQNWDGIVASNGASHAAVIEHLKPLLIEFGRVPHFAADAAS